MDESTSREKILKKVRAALLHQSKSGTTDVDFDSAIFHESEESIELIFAQQFSELNGQFVFCENETDFCENIAALVQENEFASIFCTEAPVQRLLKNAGVPFSADLSKINEANVGITACEFLVARTGSVMVSARQASGRRLVVYPNFHIVVAYTSQLVFNIRDALKGMKQRYGEQLPSSISLISGPSRTADIEKTLVQGAHGPKEIFVFLIDDTPLA